MATLLSKKTIFSKDFIYFWTAIFLLLPASTFIMIRILFTQTAIVCFVPSHMTTTMGQFLHEDCWSKETYEPLFPLPSTNITKSTLLSEEPSITSSHIWFPYILFVMFLFFTVFRGMHHVVKRGLEYRKSNLDSNLSERNLAAELAQRIEEMSNQKVRTFSLIFFKFMIFLNVLAQVLYLLSTFSVTEKDSEYRTQDGEKVHYTYVDEAFPKSILCATTVRRYSTVEIYKTQCRLPINEVFKKYIILLCLWFGLVTLLSFTHLICFFCFCFRKGYTKGIFLRILPREDVDDILEKIQNTDGLLLLWYVHKKEDLNILRDVVQLLQGSLQTNTGRDLNEKKEEIAEVVPQIVVNQNDTEMEKLDVPKV